MKANIGVMELHADVERIYNEAALAKHCNANVTIFTSMLMYERALPFFNNSKYDYTWIIKQERETLLRKISCLVVLSESLK